MKRAFHLGIRQITQLFKTLSPFHFLYFHISFANLIFINKRVVSDFEFLPGNYDVVPPCYNPLYGTATKNSIRGRIEPVFSRRNMRRPQNLIQPKSDLQCFIYRAHLLWMKRADKICKF